MKVIYFHQHFSTPQGASGIRSYGMAQQLIAKGHQVTMVCGSYGESITGLTMPFNKGMRRGMVQGIEVIEFELAYSNAQSFISRTNTFLKFAFKSVKLALKENYDLIFATTTPLTAAIPGIAAKLFRRKPFVFEVRDLWPELPKAMGVVTNPVILKGLALLEWAAYKSADGHIALSPGIKKGIQRLKIQEESIKLIPNGCDLNIFSTTTDSWQPDGIKDNDFLAVFTGTHGTANGLDAVLNAAIELKKNNVPNIKILLIGQGKLKPELMAKATQENLDNVIFHEPVNKDKLANLMQRADVGLQVLANIPAFYYGTSPNKFFDYISAGLPVLNNYPGWLADMINENNCGIAVPPENPKMFAQALIKMSQEPEELTIYAQNAQKLATDKFDRTKLAEQFVLWLEKYGDENA